MDAGFLHSVAHAVGHRPLVEPEAAVSAGSLDVGKEEGWPGAQAGKVVQDRHISKQTVSGAMRSAVWLQ
jgi:hypothetical protein